MMFRQLMIQTFPNWISLIYTKELEVKEMTETASSASVLDIYLKFDSNGLQIRWYGA